MPSLVGPLVIFAGSVGNVEAAGTGSISGCECLTKNDFTATGGHTKSGTPYSALAAIRTYGIGSCQSWDNNENTPYHDSCDKGHFKNDFCGGGTDFGGKGNWCALPWCYVNKNSCPLAHRVKSDVYAPQEMWYSYTTCDVPDCYKNWMHNAYIGVCPYTGSNEVDGSKCTSCDCLGAVPDNVLNTMSNTDSRQLIINSRYGSRCETWDDDAGTPFHDEWCKVDVDKCGDDNWCYNEWCYVNPKTCDTAVKTTVMAPSDATFSYDACKHPDCYTNTKSEGCPHDPDGLLGCDKIDINAAGSSAFSTSLLGFAALGFLA